MMRPVHLRIFAIVAVLAFLVGCSSDSGTDTTIKQGDPNDAAFLAMRADVGEVLDSLVDRNFSPLTNPWGFPIDTTVNWKDLFPMHPDDSIEYDFDDQSGWYSLYFGSFATSTNSVIIDSVVFLSYGQPVHMYNPRTNGIGVREHITKVFDGEETDYSEETYYCSSLHSNVDMPESQVDADISVEIDKYESDGGVVEHDNSVYQITVTDLQFEREPAIVEWNDNTPTAGTISLQVTFISNVTENNSTTTQTSNWNFNVTVGSDGSSFIEAISNNTRWTYTENLGS